jgi:alpha-methylacyl-CoA racemase
MGTDTGLLDGIRVLDLASVGPAARASRWLADYGADVIKVGPVPAQGGVQLVPPFYAYSGHRQMRRVLLDLKAPGGRDAFLRLAARSDVVIESFRPGVADRLGIGARDVRSVNRAVIYCSISGYGQDGPNAQRAGHDLNYLAAAGLLHCSTPGVDGRPPIPGATVADSAGGGMQAVIAILAAVVKRQTTGEGAHLDVSVADGVLALMALVVDEYLATGVVPGPGHGLLTGRFACYDTYEAGDGKWLTVAAIEPRFWANLCQAVGLEKWTAHQSDDAVQEEIRADLRRVFALRTRDEWVAELAPLDTCVAPVATVPEVIEDPQFVARGVFVEAVHSEHGTFRQVAPLLAGCEPATEPFEVRAPDASDSDEVLGLAGLSADEIEALRKLGVVA